MVVTRRGTSAYVPAKKLIKNKNIEKNITKVVKSVHGVRMKGIAVRGNVDGKSEGASSPTKLQEIIQKFMKNVSERIYLSISGINFSFELEPLEDDEAKSDPKVTHNPSSITCNDQTSISPIKGYWKIWTIV